MDHLHQVILSVIKGAAGRPSALNRPEFLSRVNRYLRDPIGERELRHAVRTLRRHGHPICSASGVGFWWPLGLGEVEACAAELDSKAKDMLLTRRMMLEGAVAHFGRQRELFG